MAKRFLIGCMFAALAALFFSCASGPVVIPEDLKPAEFFQKAQESSDRNDYDTAKLYYEALIERYPGDVQNVIAAQYEIAFIAYRQGNTVDAEARFRGIIAQYEAEGEEALPRWPLILSQKLLTRIETERAEAGAKAQPQE